jgi:hypothetical protein
MTEVRVRATRLDDGAPVVVRDTMDIYDLQIDFDQPAEDIVGALRAVFQEAVDSKRWQRHRTTNPDEAGPEGTDLDG